VIKKLFLVFFYNFVKTIAKIAFCFFYAKTTIVNRKRAEVEGAVIIVSNHPATMMDPLNVCTRVPRMVNFLANSSMFKTKFGSWFFNTFYCIPVERYKDTGGKPLNNDKAFENAIAHLSKGKMLFMCPEGSSFSERHLRQIKTGCGRIAMATAKAHNFRLNLRILPVGLTYSDGTKFRDKIVVNFGKMIQVADFQKNAASDAFEDVKKLTEEISHRLGELMINARDKAEDLFIKKLEVIQQTENPLKEEKHFFRVKNLIKNFHEAQEKNSTHWAAFSENVNIYFQQLTTINSSDRAFKNSKNNALDWLIVIVGFPFFLFGYLSHFLPTFFPKYVNNRFNSSDAFAPTFKSVTGLLSFPFFYFLQTLLVHLVFGNGWITFIYFLSIVPFGLITEQYMNFWKKFKERRNAANFKKKNPDLSAQFQQMREEILERLMQLSY
jgi:glycerol-3-phosphate O-acyltransferase/dihydroxyacetone phosphate acyltransferase